MSKTIGLAIMLLSAGALLCVAGLLINDFRQDQEIDELNWKIGCVEGILVEKECFVEPLTQEECWEKNSFWFCSLSYVEREKLQEEPLTQ